MVFLKQKARFFPSLIKKGIYVWEFNEKRKKEVHPFFSRKT